MTFDHRWSLASYYKGTLQWLLSVKSYQLLQPSIYRPPNAMKWPPTSVQNMAIERCKVGCWSLHNSTHWPPSSFFPNCISPKIHGHLLLPMATEPTKNERLHAHQWQFQNYLRSSMISKGYGPTEAIRWRLGRTRKGVGQSPFHKIPLPLGSCEKKSRNSAIF